MALLGRTSDNTLCLQHLIPILISLVSQQAHCTRDATDEPIPPHASADPTAQWWDSADAWQLYNRLIDILTDRGFVFYYRNDGADLWFGFTFALDALVNDDAMMDAAIDRDIDTDIDTLPDPHHGTDGEEGEGTCHITRSPWAALAACQAAKTRRQAYVAAYCKARHARPRGNQTEKDQG